MTGIILINFGGPRTTEEIGPFLLDILRDVLPRPLKPFAKIFARLRLPTTKKMYDAIGGSSPVVSWTMKQAQALEARLCSSPPLMGGDKGEGDKYKTYIGMKYGRPSIEEAVAATKKDGCDKVLLLPLFIYKSKYTDLTISRFREFTNLRIYEFTRSLQYIRCMVGIIKSSITDGRNISPPQTTLLFTAHSIPKSSAKREPYVRQINDSVSKIMEHFTGYNYQIAYQSAPFKFGWLGPEVKSAIRQICMSSPRTRGSRLYTRDSRFRGNDKIHLLIIPLGFACENLETLYEIDQLYHPYAKRLGLNVKRTPALNDNPIFIDLLAEMVLEENVVATFMGRNIIQNEKGKREK